MADLVPLKLIGNSLSATQRTAVGIDSTLGDFTWVRS
jgi:hypothetical protein